MRSAGAGGVSVGECMHVWRVWVIVGVHVCLRATMIASVRACGSGWGGGSETHFVCSEDGEGSERVRAADDTGKEEEQQEDKSLQQNEISEWLMEIIVSNIEIKIAQAMWCTNNTSCLNHACYTHD